MEEKSIVVYPRIKRNGTGIRQLLFVRTRKGLELTPEGEAVIGLVQAILTCFERLHEWVCEQKEAEQDLKQPIFVRSRDGVIATVFGEALLLRLQTIDKLHLPKDRSLTAEDLRVLRRQSVWYLLEREVQYIEVKYNKWFGKFPFIKDGEKIKVAWFQSDWDKGSTPPDNILSILFLLVESKKKKGQRYYIHDLWSARRGNNLWFLNKNGRYQCVVDFEHEGEMATISLIDHKFDMPENFHEEINNVSFEVKKASNGKLQAFNIHNEDGPEPPKEYKAISICNGRTAPRFFINSYLRMCTRILFANNRSLADRECPSDFQINFAKSVSNWVNLFYQYRNASDKKIYLLFCRWWRMI